MHAMATNPLSWIFGAQGWQTRMMNDADRLIQDLGDDAYATAADLAWREDVGLLRARHHGHWSRVTLEIGRRLAVSQPPLPPAPAAVFAAAPASSLRH
jgi:hypothetical protein